MHEITSASGSDRCAAWHLPAGSDAFDGPGGRPLCRYRAGLSRPPVTTACSAMPRSSQQPASMSCSSTTAGAASPVGSPVSSCRCGASGKTCTLRSQHFAGYQASMPSGSCPRDSHTRAGTWSRLPPRNRRVAATISVTPAMDGIPVLLQLARTAGLRHIARSSAHGLRDGLRARTGRPPYVVAVVANRARVRSSRGRAASTCTARSRGRAGATSYARAWHSKRGSIGRSGSRRALPARCSSRSPRATPSPRPPRPAVRPRRRVHTPSCGSTRSTLGMSTSAPRNSREPPISWSSCAAFSDGSATAPARRRHQAADGHRTAPRHTAPFQTTSGTTEAE